MVSLALEKEKNPSPFDELFPNLQILGADVLLC